MDARRLAPTFPLPRRTGAAHHGPWEGRANRDTRDPAGVERRLDLAEFEREAAGDGYGCGGPAAVPLPRQLPGRARAGEVRQTGSVRRGAAESPPGDVRAHVSRAGE